MKSKKKWIRPEVNSQYLSGLETLRQLNTYGLSEPVLEFLYNRGIHTKQALEQIMETGADRELDPYDLTDVPEAVNALMQAVETKKKIVVYGDYDADGVCATTIAVQCLRNLGADVTYFINNRFVEGYGINVLGVENLLKRYPETEFILTVDNGIVAFEGVAYAKSKGIEVLITDHHLAKAEIPDALAVVNPHRLDDTSLFKDICGATVIYKVMMALYWEMGLDMDYVTNMIDLVGMATVGDVMPLWNENRFYVNEALRLIERGTRPQMTILKEKKNVGVLNEEVFGFQFVPTINAVGRLEGCPDKAMQFFLSEDVEEMHILAEELIAINDERKEITTEQENLSERLLEAKGMRRILVVSHPDFHEGIVGLVAGRLKEKYNRPAIVFSEENGRLKGSARSIDAFHIKDAFDEVAYHILQYGGHKLAAGLSIDASQLEAFEDAINDLADDWLTDEDMQEKMNVDAVLKPEDVTKELIEELDSLRPFGQGFVAPVFGLTAFEVDKAIFMGKDKNHLKLINNQHKLEVVMFKYAEDYRLSGEPKQVKALGTPKLNIFQNRISLQFSVAGDCLAY